MIVFFDPSCPHCENLREALLENRDAFVKASRQVWFIPIWLIRPESLLLGGKLLETGEFPARDARIGADEVRPRWLRQVLRNTGLFAMASVERPSVPLVLWRNGAGDDVQMKAGVPGLEDLKALAAGRLEVRGP